MAKIDTVFLTKLTENHLLGLPLSSSERLTGLAGEMIYKE